MGKLENLLEKLKLPGTITFSSSSGHRGSFVSIEVRDSNSGNRFLSIEMSHEEFGRAIMGLAERPITMSVQGLNVVGKTKESQELKFEVPEDLPYGEERLEILSKLARKACPKGWEPVLYFSSQNSITHEGKKRFAHTHAVRFV